MGVKDQYLKLFTHAFIPIDTHTPYIHTHRHIQTHKHIIYILTDIHTYHTPILTNTHTQNITTFINTHTNISYIYT